MELFLHLVDIAKKTAAGVGTTSSRKDAINAAWAAADADPSRRYLRADEVPGTATGRWGGR